MSQLSPAKTVPAPTQTLLVPLDAIEVEAQVRRRFGKDDLAELAESIKANGILQPVLLRTGKNGHYRLIDGERRWRAARAAGITHIPALVGSVDDAAKFRMQLAANLDREDLDEREVGEALDKLLKIEGSLDKVAAVCKRSIAWVSKHIGVVQRMGYRTQQLMETGKVADLEIAQSFEQLQKASYDVEGGFKAVEAMQKKLATSTVTRDEIRTAVAELKAKKRVAPDRDRDDKPKKKAKPKFRPDAAVRDLFQTAYSTYGRRKLPSLDGYTDAERAALAKQLQKWHDEGKTAAAEAKDDPYKGILTQFYPRRYEREGERAAWIAGFFNKPLDVQQLLKDVFALRQ